MNLRQAVDLAVIILDPETDITDPRITVEEEAEAMRILSALASTLSSLGL